MRSLMQILSVTPNWIARQFSFKLLPQDMGDTLRGLAADLDSIRANGAPDPDVLAVAPLLENWTPALTPIGLVLIGEVTGHPSCTGPLSRTSPIWIVAHDLSWARSLSRFYRLGTASDAAAISSMH